MNIHVGRVLDWDSVYLKDGSKENFRISKRTSYIWDSLYVIFPLGMASFVFQLALCEKLSNDIWKFHNIGCGNFDHNVLIREKGEQIQRSFK